MSNIRSRFEDLVPGRQTSLAQVVTFNANGTAKVANSAGDNYIVRTAITVAASDNVLVRDGQIVAKVPGLSVFAVSV